MSETARKSAGWIEGYCRAESLWESDHPSDLFWLENPYPPDTDQYAGYDEVLRQASRARRES